MKKGPGILVVDDEERIRKFCREVLELQGFEVEEASNGREALQILARNSFQLVLSDIMMPDLGGLELTEKVKELYPDTFVILITGHGTIDTAKKAIQHGAFDFITKPFKMTELNQAVDRALEVRRKHISELPSPELMDLYRLTTSIDVSPRSRETFLSDLVGTLMRTFRGDAARIYLSESPGLPGLVSSIGAGKESILTDHDWRTYALAAQMDEGDILVGPDTDIPLPPTGTVASVMAGPIPTMEGIIGVGVVARGRLPGGFTRRDLKLMGLFAAQAGNQLMNYRLAGDLRRHASELEKINLLTTSFSSSLDTSHVLSSIGRGLMTMVPFDLFGVFLSGEGLLPLSYVLARSDMPEDVFLTQLRSRLEQYRDPNIVEQFLDSRYRDSFASLREADWTAAPDIRILDLGEYGSFGGMMVLAAWSRHHAPLETSSFLPILVRHAAAALSNAYHYETSERNYIQAITALAGAVDAKDPYTSNHSRNVAAYVMIMNNHLHLTDRDANWLHNAALLHDIGKIGIPESILNKTGSLSDAEMEIIRKHPDMGYRILKPVTAFGGFIDAVRYHHERFDGRGYPHGLSGERIPFLARILTVADSFDAMTSDRVYRASHGPDFAQDELVRNSGSQFDPDLVRLFSEVLRKSSPEEIIHEYIASDRRHFPLS
jgi:response regulator RpfG family c-di-GMP phosphodiesterase